MAKAKNQNGQLFGLEPGDLVLHRNGFEIKFAIFKHGFQDRTRALVVFNFFPYFREYETMNTEIVSLADLDLVKKNFANDF